ncbi:MAG: hypothetical protein CMJ72_01180 [Planctomycetaceae bacterium]|nr:hypothetical protein [Planctomycetaceae bacterium]HCK40359.1 hypothetical protein [Planctomycetaceae bacterium]
MQGNGFDRFACEPGEISGLARMEHTAIMADSYSSRKFAGILWHVGRDTFGHPFLPTQLFS